MCAFDDPSTELWIENIIKFGNNKDSLIHTDLQCSADHKCQKLLLWKHVVHHRSTIRCLAFEKSVSYHRGSVDVSQTHSFDSVSKTLDSNMNWVGLKVGIPVKSLLSEIKNRKNRKTPQNKTGV